MKNIKMGLAQFPCSRSSKSTRCHRYGSWLHRQNEMPLRGKEERRFLGRAKPYTHSRCLLCAKDHTRDHIQHCFFSTKNQQSRHSHLHRPHTLRFGEVTCPRSHSQSATEEGFKLSAVTPAPRLFPPSWCSGAQEVTLAGFNQKTRGKAP